MKLQYLLIICFLSSMLSVAQKIDQERMDRDLAIAEEALSTILSEEKKSGNRYHISVFPSVTSSYVDNFGVIFNIPDQVIRVWKGQAVGVNRLSKSQHSYSFSGTGVVRATAKSESAEGKEEQEESEMVVVSENVEGRENSDTEARDETISKIKLFLADYAFLISQLKDEEKILITDSKTNLEEWPAFYHGKHLGSLSVEVKYEDIASYKNGKIDRDQLMEKIEVRNKEEKEAARDLQLFSSMLGRLFQSDLSDSYYTTGSVGFEFIDDLGVIYRMKVYSSMQKDTGHEIVTLDLKGLTQEERDSKVKELYPVFVQSLKESLVDYGRTIQSLTEGEMLIVQVGLTRCNGCDIPENIELSVAQNALQAFNEGKMTREKALESIKIKESGKQ